VTKSDVQSQTASAVKENVVDGVLQNYLDQLLVTATEPQRIEKEIQFQEDEITAEVPAIEELKVEKIDTRVSVEPVVTPEIEHRIEQKVEEKIVPIVAHLTDQDSWSSQGVECLIFSVCGLKLAVPLLFLGGVHEVEKDDVKPLMGQPKWYLGVLPTDESNLQVIDTSNFIMPEKEQNLSELGYKYLIQLEKTPWAIACQSIDDTVRLEASEIKWRGDRGKRAWLAGTVIEKMCALVDVSGLLKRVESSCKPA
jgi:purine-binding chemotaxis protein CheW